MSRGGRQHQDPPPKPSARRAWQPRLFPELAEPVVRPTVELAHPHESTRPQRPPDWAKRPKSLVERVDLTARRPRLTPELEAWLDGLASAETRRAYRRDALFLMSRLSVDTEQGLAALERRDAVRYRDLLQRLVDGGDCSAGLARRRMAAALSLFDHLQRQYLVTSNPFYRLRRPREPDPAGASDSPGVAAGTGSGNARCRRRGCRRPGCPLAALGAAGTLAMKPARQRRSRRSAGVEPLQLRLW